MSSEKQDTGSDSHDHNSQSPENSPTVLGSQDDLQSKSNKEESQRHIDSTFLGHSDAPNRGTEGDFQITPQTYVLREYALGDRYELHEEIARGGMGMVLKGRDLDLGRDLAIKVLLQRGNVSPDVMRRFVEEAQIGGQLQHPGIVPVYAVGKFSDSRPFFAMKLVKGQTLGKMLRDRESLDADRTKFVGIFEQVCQTMAYAHSRFVIHRDLKPDNIMVGAFGEVQVMDWGLAKIIKPECERERKATQSVTDPMKSIVQTIRSSDSGGSGRSNSDTNRGSILGTPAYMPPEQALGEVANLDERADVFGLGAILCEILTGKPPYNSGSGTANVRNAVRGNLVDAYARLDACGADLDLIRVAKSCLAAEQDDRPRNAGVVSEAVTSYLHSVGARIVEAEQQRIAAETRVVGERKQRKLLVALAASLLLLVSSVSIGTIMMQKKDARLALEKTKQMEKQVTNAKIIQEQNVRISATNGKLVETQAEAVRQQQLAESLLSDMQASYGLIAARDGESGQAALWFSQAAESAVSDKYRFDVNRIRTRNWIAATPQPVNSLRLETGAEFLRSFVFQPAGYVLLMLQSTNLRLWDLITGKEIDGSWGTVYGACWSPDGNWLFATDDAGVIRRYSTETWKSEVVTQLPNPAVTLTFSPDGRFLGCVGSELQIWDTERRRIVEGDLPNSRALGIHFSHDSQQFVVSNIDQTATAFSIMTTESTSSATRLAGPIPQSSYVNGQAILIDGDRILSVNPQDQAITLTPLSETGESQIVLSEGASPIGVSSDRKHLVLAGKTNGILYSNSGGSLNRVGEISHNDAQITDAAFTEDGRTVVTVGWDQAARIWNTADATLRLAPIPFTGIVHRCTITADGAFLATADRDKAVHIYSLPLAQVPQILVQNVGVEARLSPNGIILAPTAWHQDPWMVHADTPLQLFDLNKQESLPLFSLPGRLVDSCVTFDNQYAAAVCYVTGKQHLVAFNIVEQESAMPPIELTGMPLSIASSPKARQIAVLTNPGRIFTMDPATSKIQWDRTLDEWAESERMWPNVQYTPDGTKIVVLTGGKENRVEVLNSSTGEPVFPPIKPVLSEGPCRVILVSPSGKYLATGVNGRNAAQVWDLETGAALCEPLPHPGDFFGIYCLAFSPDEKLLLTGHKDRQVRIWDWKSGKIAGPVLEHADEVWSIKVFPNGMQLASSGRDGCVMLWDLPSGKLIAPPLDLGESVTSLQLSNSGQTLFATTSDRIISAVTSCLHIIDLEKWTSPAVLNEKNERRLAELVSGRMVDSDSIRRLDAKEWSDRLQVHRDLFPKFGIPTETDRVASLRRIQHDAIESENWTLAAGVVEKLQKYLISPEKQSAATLERIPLLLDAFLTHSALHDTEKATADLKQLAELLKSNDSVAKFSEKDIERLAVTDVSHFTSTQVRTLIQCITDRSQYSSILLELQNNKQWTNIVVIASTMHQIVDNPELPEFADPWFRLGYAASVMGDYERAVDAYLHATKIDSTYHWAYNNLGWCLASLERHEESLAALQTAVQLVPAEPECLENLADQQLKMCRFDDAVRTFHRAMAVKGSSASQVVDGLISKTDVLLEYRMYDDAVLGYKAAIAIAPERTEFHSKLQNALSLSHRNKEALEHARLAASATPDSPATLCALAHVLIANGMSADAEMTAHDVLRISPNYVDGHLVLALALLALDKPDDAIASVQAALATPDGISVTQTGVARLYQARALRAKADLPGSLDAAREAAKRLPDIVSGHDPMGLLGEILLAGEFEATSDAERAAKKISEIIFRNTVPENNLQRINAAERCYYLDRFRQSAELFTEAIKADPENAGLLIRYDSICAAVRALGQPQSENNNAWKFDTPAIIARMQAELELQRSELHSNDPTRIHAARRLLKRFLVDEDFLLIRGESLPPEFDETLAQGVKQFWGEIERLVTGSKSENE